jgi:hypothetical protein
MQIYTLIDLANHCYQQWISTNKTGLPSGAIEWMRDNLGEPALDRQIDEIFTADIKPSEKCYRFLKLTGAIERERLINLLKKQILDEIERERKQKLQAEDEKWRHNIEKERKKTFNKPTESSYPFTVFAIIIAVVCGGVGAVSAGSFGWEVGLSVGTIIAYTYRATRASTAAQDYAAQTKNNMEQLRHEIEKNISNRKNKINEDIVLLEHQYSLPLSESVKNQLKEAFKTTTASTSRKEMSYNYTALVIALVILIIMPFFLSIGKQSYSPTSSKTSSPAPAPAPAPAPPLTSSQVRTTRSVIAVAVGSDNQPLGVDTTFNEDTVRNSGKLVYYVNYDGAISNQTKFKAMWYRDGNVIGDGDDYTIQYPSGNFYNTLNYNFTPGNYEARLFVDGNEVNKVFFNVSASIADAQRAEEQRRQQEAERQRQEAEYRQLQQRRSFKPPSRELRSDGWKKSRESVTYEDN